MRLPLAIFTAGLLLTARAGDLVWTADPHAPGTTGPALATNDVRIADAEKPHNAWTAFPPLSAARGLTVSARLEFENPLKRGSANQLRWYLAGRDRDQWKDVAVVAGLEREGLVFELWACAGTNANLSSFRAHTTLARQVATGEPPAAGTPVRLVTSVRQHADGSCDVGGLLGTAAFEFKGVNIGVKLPELSQFGMMLGASAGVSNLVISRVRIDPAGP